MEKLIELLKKMIREKAEYRASRKLLEALPNDYQFVYNEIEKYLFNATGDENVMQVLMNILEAFSIAAQDGKPVLSIIGEDAGYFCDNLIKNSQVKRMDMGNNGEQTTAQKYLTVWIEEQREKMNKRITEKIGVNNI
jgi:DNA-binding ferritin-like protein (Dps family)